MRWWLAAALLAGCVEPQLQRCGELLCSADSVCLNNTQCATPESIEACRDLPDGMACSTALFAGTCLNGACTAPRCGDGFISGSEQCDGPVSGVDCVMYGFDTGVPSCSAQCSLDVVESCARFGWERVSSASAELAWTNGTELAVVPPDRRHVVLSGGAQTVSTETAADIHTLVGRDRTVVAATVDGAVVRSQEGAAFAPVAIGPIPAAQYELAIDDTGSLFVAIFDASTTRIWKEVGTGAWQNILTLSQPASFVKFVDGFLYVGYANGEVRRWNGAWSATLFSAPSPLTDLAVRAASYFIATESSGDYEVVGSTLTRVWDKDFPTVLAAPDGVYFGGEDIGVLRRTNDSLLEVLDAPIFGRLMTDGTHVYIYGNGVYRYSGTQFARRTGVNEPAADAVLFGSGEIGVASLSQVLTVAGPEGWTYATPAQPPIALAGHSKTDFFVSGGSIVEHSNGSVLTPIAMPTMPIALEDLAWQDSTSTLFAVGKAGLGLRRFGTVWTQISPLPCDLHGLALHGTTVYAVGTCGTEGVIWQLDANNWTELHRVPTPLRSLWADDADNLYAAGPDGGTTRIGGTWKTESQARGISISATGPTDIWVGGGPDDLIHYDGSAWSRVRIVGAASPRVVATPRSVYIAGATTSVLAR